MGHELDNGARKRLFRIEYKQNGERLSLGQARHLRALLDAVHGTSWRQLVVLVIDEGQTMGADHVRFRWAVSTAPADINQWVATEITTVDNLARRISTWLWGKEALSA